MQECNICYFKHIGILHSRFSNSFASGPISFRAISGAYLLAPFVYSS